MISSRLSAVGLLAALPLFAAPAAAQQLAVPGKTPANPTLIVSVPSSEALWQSASASTTGRAILESGLAAGPLSAARADVLADVEQNTGISFEPASLMTQTITGLDFYRTEHATLQNFVLNIQFADAAALDRLMNQLRREAATASGVSGGVSGDTVVEGALAGVRSLFLPAFQMYLAADGSTLTWSNHRPTLESALANQGQAVFDSDYFRRNMEPLRGQDHQLWVFGELDQLSPTRAMMTGPDDVGYSMAAVAGFARGHFKLSAFRHQEEMMPAERRYTLSTPAAGNIPALSWFPADTVAVYASNAFDGLSILDMMTDSAGGTIDPAMINSQIDGLKMLLGFDVREDLLANIGPDLGIGLSGLKTDAPLSPDSANLSLVVGVKNRDAFQRVLDPVKGLLEGMTSGAGPAPPAGDSTTQPGDGEGTTEEAPPPPQAASAMETSTVSGEELVTYKVAAPGATGLNPAWSLTTSNHFLFSSSGEAARTAITLSKSGARGVTSAERYRAATGMIESNLNDVFFVDLQRLSPLLDGAEAMMAGAGPVAATPEAGRLLEALKGASALASGSRYMSTGRSTEVVILFD